MGQERLRKAVLVVVGLLFVAVVYPIGQYLWRPGDGCPGDTMMLSLYLALGIFLLMAVRNPSANRSLIAYTGWANVAHATVMGLMAIHPGSDRRGLAMAAAIFGSIGLVLIAVLPAKASSEQLSTAGG
jgi:hypothetical protein